jgi:hypothetical protein
MLVRTSRRYPRRSSPTCEALRRKLRSNLVIEIRRKQKNPQGGQEQLSTHIRIKSNWCIWQQRYISESNMAMLRLPWWLNIVYHCIPIPLFHPRLSLFYCMSAPVTKVYVSDFCDIQKGIEGLISRQRYCFQLIKICLLAVHLRMGGYIVLFCRCGPTVANVKCYSY